MINQQNNERIFHISNTGNHHECSNHNSLNIFIEEKKPMEASLMELNSPNSQACDDDQSSIGTEGDDDQAEEHTFEELRDQMMDFDYTSVNEYSLDELYSIVNYMYSIWCSDYDFMKLHERNLILFGEHAEMRERFQKFSSNMIALERRMVQIEKGEVDVEEEVDPQVMIDHRNRLAKTCANISWGYDSMVQTYRQMFCNDDTVSASLPDLKIDAFFKPIVADNMKNHQKLLKFYLEECGRRGYRKHASALYAPKFTEDGHFTRTYTFACDIGVFIYDAIYPKEQYEFLFSALTERGGTSRLCAEYLEKCKENELPQLIKDRTKFSFKNGLFNARTNMFFPYGTDVDWKEKNIVCANYIDLEFNNELYNQVIDPLDIPTPNIQKILDDQQFDKDVCRWFYASIGRMLFPVGDMDNWQYFPFCKGTAGSGKSTLLHIAAKFYSDDDVGTLMNEGQKNFSIEHFFDKFVFYCYDVDEKMTFSQTRWNQMVSGENVAIERKFKVPIQKKWTVSGAFAGNNYPPWIDQAGNISRRMLIFMFSKIVTKIDSYLDKKCKLELACFMKKCVACYHEMVDRYGHKGIWDRGVLPTYFHDTRKQMQSETNPLQAFIISEQCIIKEEYSVSFEEFRNSYKSFCETSGLPKKRLTKDFCANVFKQSEIKWFKNSRDVECLQGIALNL